MIWVIDASVAVRWFLKNESHPHADSILSRVIDRPEDFAVPELFCFEVYSVLCRVHPTGHSVFVDGMVPILNSGIFRQPMTPSLLKRASLATMLAMLPWPVKLKGNGSHLIIKLTSVWLKSKFRIF